ncbi:hypothetical protein [Citrobacter freundii]|uniref:hypothetical protein n=1 Tax=Citrobacter freundii TaxID=546 RepID=UPI0040428BD4
MSTITKELAKLFRKITNSEIDAEGNAHVVLSPADSLLINNARIALASLEAEAVACIDRANLDYLESGADADVWPASGAGSDDVLLYAAPQLPQPAVLSVPDEIPKLKDGMGFKYVKDGVRYSLNYANGWNACRAAMLQAGNHTEQYLDMVDHSGDANEKVDCRLTFDQWLSQQNEPIDVDCGCVSTEAFYHWLRVAYEAGNSPVAQDCWCRTCRPVTMSDMRFVVCPECGNKRCPHANDHRNACTGSNEPGQVGSAYPAAPQQEVKSALEHGMQRYAGAMQKLSEGDK